MDRSLDGCPLVCGSRRRLSDKLKLILPGFNL